MAGNTVKEMTPNFGKLDKFEGHDFRRWQKKMHFSLTTLKNVESDKELWDSLKSKYMAEDASSKKFLESLRAQDSDKGKGKEVDGPSVNMTEEGHFKRDCRSGNKKNANAGGSGKGSKDQSQDQGQNLVDAIAWWIDSGATTHVCKDRCWFKTYEMMEIYGSCGYKQVYESDKYILSKSGVFVGFGYYNNGIIHGTTAPYTPQKNGVAKRKNRALKEMVNSIIPYSGLIDGL
ncbi:zinc finger, CCHC-type containing protein [Tanacetum coccineum]